jgi:FixJ family two-component response regulator
MTESMQSKPCVFVVDDDRNVLKAFSRLLGTAGYAVKTFESPRDFLEHHDPSVPGCALLDVGMSEIDGLSLQEQLRMGGNTRPIIFVTGRDDVKTGVRAMKAGAVDYLTKPVQEQTLLAAVESAIEADLKAAGARRQMEELRARYATLTTREQEVMSHVIRGRLNKQIAADLDIVEKTVKVHRAHVMEKMQVRTVAALVQTAERIGIGREV